MLRRFRFRRISTAVTLLLISLLPALTARAQLRWSEYSDAAQTINGTSYAAGDLIASNVATGGDTLTGGANATVSFTVPAGASVDFATSNFAPFTLSSTNASAKVSFTMSATGGLSTAGRVFVVGLLNSSGATLTHSGYTTIANTGNSGLFEHFTAPLSGTTARNGGLLAYDSTTKLSSGKSIAFSLADNTTYTGFFQLKWVSGNVQIGSSGTGANAGISLANGAAIDSGYGTSTASVYANPTYTVNTLVFGYYNATGSPVTLTVGGISLAPLGPPTIQTQPADVVTSLGASATFTVAAAANPVATYQWYLGSQALADGTLSDGSTVSGATTASLTINNAQLDQNGGNVSVVVTNSYGSTTSNPATLTVASTSTPPAITTQPANASVNAGATATFAATASGSPVPAYQWYFTPAGGTATALVDGNGISGSTAATLTIAVVNPLQAGSYYVVATNSGGSATSAAATLAVTDGGPSIAAVAPTGAGAAACIDTPLAITFSSAVHLGTTGTVKIYKTSTHALVDTIDVAASSMTGAQILAAQGIEAIASSKIIQGQSFNYYPIIVSGSTATIYPHTSLEYGASYYVTIDTGVFVDAATSHAFIGIYDQTTWTFATKSAGPAANSTWLTVAADGTGNFCTVQGALDFLPSNNTTPTTIWISDGTYYGLIFDNARSNVTFLGQSRAGTILAYANNNNFDSAGGSFYHRGAVEIYANDVSFLNLTIRNTTPHGGSQAEALILSGSRNIVSSVNLYSYQDTFQAKGPTYIADSTIQGDVDFLWGYGANFFSNCHITEVTNGGYYVQVRNAQPSGTTNHGNVFVNCTLDGASGVTGNYLARIDPTPGSGFPYSEMVLIDCALGDNLAPAGWLLNNATSGPDLNWAYSGLTKASDGTAYDTSTWSYAHALTDSTVVQNYRTPSYVLNGWTPAVTPILIAQPAAQTISLGAGATLSVTAVGVPEVTYQWYRDGTAIADATTASYSIPSAGAGDSGLYTAAVSNGITTTTSTGVPVIVSGGLPVITTSPKTQSALAGGSVSFASAAMNGPVSYQWLKDGTPISGATRQSFTKFNLQAADAGNYTVAVTNTGGAASGTVTSAAATLTVVTPASANGPLFPVIPAVVFNVTDYGAVGDGATDNTAAIQAAISAATAAGGGIVELPPASAAYLSGPLTLYSNIDLQIDGGATLAALPFGAYPNSSSSPAHLITVNSGSSNVAITGNGVIEGQGTAWWAAYNGGTISSRPRLIQINKSSRVLVTGLTLRNSPMFHLAMTNTNSNITVYGLTIAAPGSSPNTDGIDATGSSILVQGCSISVGDDNVAVKCENSAVTNLTVANCAFGVGHGLSVGGQTNLGLDGMTVTNCTFDGTTSGLRLKSDATQGGVVQNVSYSNLTMTNVAYPIVFYSYYNQVGTPGATSGSSQTTAAKVAAWNGTPPNSLAATTIPVWRNITISNLTATGASGSSTVWGLPLANALIANVTFNNVNISGGAGLELYDATNVQFTGTNNVGTLVPVNALAITSQPQSQTATVGGTVSFTASAIGSSAVNSTAPTLRWALNGVALADGLQSDGSTISGASTGTLTISNVRSTRAGTYTFTATGTLDGYDVTASALAADSLNVSATSSGATLTVNPLPATVSLSGLTHIYDSRAKSPTVTTSPIGLTVAVTYDGGAQAPVTSGSYVVVARVTDPNYSGSATGTLVISPDNSASIALSGLVATYDGSAHPVTATTSPLGIPVTVTYAGSYTAPTAAGSYLVTATFADANYGGSAIATLVIAKANQSVTFPAVGTVDQNTPVTLGATASSGLPVTFTVVSGAGSITGNVLTVTGTETVTVRATQAGNANYNAASSDITIGVSSRQAQTITFGALGTHQSNEAAFNLIATASSGLPVSFAVVSGPAIVNGAVLTLTGAPGTVTVRASQAGDATFRPAPNVDQTFEVKDASIDIFIGTLTANATSNNLPRGYRAEALSTGAGDVAAAIAAGTREGNIIIVAPSVNLNVVLSVSVGADGNYSVPFTRDGQNFTLAGTLANGVLSGSIAGLNVSFTTPVLARTGPTSTMAGFYTAPALDGAQGTAYSIVGPTGEALVLVVTPTLTTGGLAQVATDGNFNVTTTTGAAISGTLNASVKSLASTVTTGGQTTSFSGVKSDVLRTDRLINLSSRGRVSGGERIVISGFVIGGTQPKSVLIRAVGPGLSRFGVSGVLSQPSLRLYGSQGLIAENKGWSTAANQADIAAAFGRLGAFALATGSGDSAVLMTLEPGAYTAQVSDDGPSGVALLEIYDGSLNAQGEYQRLANISTRGDVGAGENVLIGGFVLTGNAPKKLLIRGVGPGLSRFNVPGTLADPLLRVYRDGALVAQNDNWGSGEGSVAADVSTAAGNAGAFALTAGAKDAALILTLPPGAYSAQVSGVDGATGVALLEIYELP